MNRFEKLLTHRLESVPDFSAITPGLVMEVSHRRRLLAHVEYGQVFRYYDLASLTKVIFSASLAIEHFAKKPHALDEPIADVLSWWPYRTTPRQLLTHAAGLEWWIPMYKKLRGPLLPDSRWRQMKSQLRKVKPKKRKVSIYSDVDLWMLGAYLQESYGESLLTCWHKVANQLEIANIFFHPRNQPKFARKLYAPTEDCPWRRRVLQGEVHDENAWALGGIAPHAGLFGTVEGVTEWGHQLRRSFLQDNGPLNQKMVRHFVGRRTPRSLGDWGLGFMKPSLRRASAGRYFSKKSFGHTGFTGTSYWYDPTRDLQVVILSNRVHPTRDNTRFVSLRPQLHNWIVADFEDLF